MAVPPTNDTLAELLDYNYTQPVHYEGVLGEEAYLDYCATGKAPLMWSSFVSGGSAITISADQYPSEKLTGTDKTIYIKHAWQVPLTEAVPDVFEMIVYLKPLIPKGGNADDVRVVFDFDS